jgi:hypothetical protein
MAIKSFLQGLGATHLWELNNNGTLAADNLGDSSNTVVITGGSYSFEASPVCIGVTHSLRVSANTNTNVDGAIFTDSNDINSIPMGYTTGTRSILLWFRQEAIENPTCIFEQGGGTNNFAFMGGAQITFQAADAGQPFLIATSKSLAIAGRNYCTVGVWEYHTQHAGSGNRVLLYLNGVLQGISELSGTDSFPNHSGDITAGNSGESLKSFAETTYTSQTTAKNENYLGFYNNVSLTESECRQIFERMVIPEVVIAADTVANQQTALNALSGNTYQDVNCAIEIRQATDATDYTLTLNNISFVQNPNLRDIAVQYVGINTLTIVNIGSNAEEVSVPPEKDLDGGVTIVAGGGNIVVLNPASVSLTGLQVNSEVRAYVGTDPFTAVEVAGVENSSTSFTFTQSEAGNDGYIVVAAQDYENLKINITYIAQNQSIPIQQRFDRNYRND